MTIRTVSQVFEDLAEELTGEERVPVDMLLEGLHERGFGFLLLLFALPMALPVPKPPGITTIFAVPLLLLTVQQALGFHTVWFPAVLRKKTLPAAAFKNFTHSATPWLRHIERIVRPRFGFLTQGVFSHLVGVCGALMAVSVSLPLPLTNTVPAMGIALMAVGVAMRDGLAVLAGAALGLTWIGMLCFLVLFFGDQGIEMFRNTVGAWL